MKILLTTINSKYIHQNLAIRLLYALNQHQSNLSWKEFTIKENSDIIADYCAQFEIVAFSCYIWNITKTLEVASKIKAINPNTKIMLGGPEVSYDWETTLQNSNIDYIIPDEGEIPFASFLDNYPQIEKCEGVAWKIGEDIFFNKNNTLFSVEELRNINPYQFDTEDELKNKITYLEASRGCPYRCGYCLAGLDNKLRYLPIESVKANLLYTMQYAKTIKFLDRTFNADPKFAISILQFILDNHQHKTSFQFEIKADLPQTQLIDYINKNITKGIFRFEIGIQTLNTKSSDSVQRKQDFDNIRSFIKQVEERVDIHLDLIVGLPHDYWEDVKYSFEAVFKLYQPELQLGFLKFLKGTPIRKDYETHGYQFDPLPPYQIKESKYLSVSELEQISLVEHALDIYWNKKRTVNTLKYIAENYSIFDYLLGLGDYFQTKTGLHHYNINDVYDNIYHFSEKQFPDDKILPQLIAIDFYLQHKIKPGNRFLPEVEKSERVVLMNRLKLNHHKYRFAMYRIDFDIQLFMQKNIIHPANDYLIVQYDGVHQSQIVFKID